MSKIIALNFPTHGCINSLLKTIAELVNRGETVIYYCAEEFRDKIEKTGAEFRPYQGNIAEFGTSNYNIYDALKSQVEMILKIMEHNLDAIRKEAPDFIVHDSLLIQLLQSPFQKPPFPRISGQRKSMLQI